ncbi:hypothetical protein L914_05005, partial [Phytophthora nicotianae]
RQLTRSGHRTICPVRAAIVLLHHAAKIDSSLEDPICLVSESELLQASAMAKVLRLAAKALGADPSRYSCHLLRSGGARALLAAGVDSTRVELHGRWKSEVFFFSATRDTASHHPLNLHLTWWGHGKRV